MVSRLHTSIFAVPGHSCEATTANVGIGWIYMYRAQSDWLSRGGHIYVVSSNIRNSGALWEQENGEPHYAA